MQTESITMRQAQCLLILFMMGSGIMQTGSCLGQDSWLALLLGAVFSAPLLLVFARVMKLYPERNLFDIMETLFGKAGGKICTALIVWYVIHLGASILRSFSGYIKITALHDTPELAVLILMVLVTAYLAKSGIKTIGKWSVAIFPIVLLLIGLTTLLPVNEMDFSNIMPVLTNPAGKIMICGVRSMVMPFGELMPFLCVARSFSKKNNPYALYMVSLLIGASLYLIRDFRNIFLLGPAMLKLEYFPSFIAARLIHIGSFITRIEGTISMIFILAGIPKIALCLLAAGTGMAKLADIPDPKRLIIPVGLAALALSAILFENIIEQTAFIQVYWPYGILFQILIPLAVWIAAELRAHRAKAADTPLRAGAGS